MKDIKPSDNGSSDPAEWTVMIYMAGDNNLAQDCVNALIGLKGVNTGDDIHVITQLDPGDPRISSRRIVINREGKKHFIRALVTHQLGKLDGDRVLFREGKIRFGARNDNHDDTPHEEGVLETDTGNPKTLFDFISWSSQEFPAKRYMLILAGHSSGVEDGFLLRDEHPAQAMKLTGLKEVLRQTRDTLGITLEILGMDSCLMSMVEICFELKGLAKVLVGSQSMTPNPGWPYAEILTIMNAKKGRIEADELASAMVHSYIRSYVDQAINSGTSTDLAALKIDAAAEVSNAVRNLAGALTPRLSHPVFKSALVLSHWQAQSYNGELFVDLRDFCDLLISRLAAAPATDGDLTTAIREVTDCCHAVQEAIGGMVLESCFCGIDFQYSNGVSIYFPWSIIFFDYRNLGFAKEEGADWYRFLRCYIERTRRRPRGEEPGDEDHRMSDPGVLVQDFILSEADVFTRKVEPLTHGPSNLTQSMRNPPRRLADHTIKGCNALKDI